RRSLPAALVVRRAASATERAARRDVARRPAAAADARLRAPRGLAPQALPGAARDDGPLAGVGALGAGLRRARAARLPISRALVDLPGSVDPAEDDPRRHPRARRLVATSAARGASTAGARATYRA